MEEGACAESCWNYPSGWRVHGPPVVPVPWLCGGSWIWVSPGCAGPAVSPGLHRRGGPLDVPIPCGIGARSAAGPRRGGGELPTPHRASAGSHLLQENPSRRGGFPAIPAPGSLKSAVSVCPPGRWIEGSRERGSAAGTGRDSGFRDRTQPRGCCGRAGGEWGHRSCPAGPGFAFFGPGLAPPGRAGPWPGAPGRAERGRAVSPEPSRTRAEPCQDDAAEPTRAEPCGP